MRRRQDVSFHTAVVSDATTLAETTAGRGAGTQLLHVFQAEGGSGAPEARTCIYSTRYSTVSLHFLAPPRRARRGAAGRHADTRVDAD